MTASLTPPAGYGPIVPLDTARHAGLGLSPKRGFAWYGGFNAVPVSALEIPRAGRDYPIAFARDPADGTPLPLAVLGLADGQNLFVDDAGRWRPDAYVPAYVRRHPFCLAQAREAGAASPRSIVCVEEAALVPGEAPLFDASGKPTAAWEPIRALLEADDAARRQTATLMRALDAASLLAPFDALAVPPGGTPLKLQGMLRLDEAKLAGLPGRRLREWAGDGTLRVLYAHLMSLENFARLLDITREPNGR